MSEPKHTPGPWALGWGPMGRQTVSGKIGLIAILCEHDIGHSEHEQDDANARLIAAAPDLLAALKALMEVQDCDGDCWCIEVGNPGTCEACQARAAIAKAEGRR